MSRLDLIVKLDIPPLVPYMQAATPVKTGDMRDSWREYRDTNYVVVTNSVPYAAIQYFGGYVPPYRNDKVMRAIIDGKPVFFYSRKGFYLKGHEAQFSDAISKWFSKIRVIT